MSVSSWTVSDPSPTYRTVRAITERALGIPYHQGSGFLTDDLDLEDVVECPHCGGVISSPWGGSLAQLPCRWLLALLPGVRRRRGLVGRVEGLRNGCGRALGS